MLAELQRITKLMNDNGRKYTDMIAKSSTLSIYSRQRLPRQSPVGPPLTVQTLVSHVTYSQSCESEALTPLWSLDGLPGLRQMAPFLAIALLAAVLWLPRRPS